MTGACLLLRRENYVAIGGMDEALFAVTLNDVDLCLKASQRGLRVLIEPAAVLIHHESKTRPADIRPDQRERRLREMNAFRHRWADRLDDPHYPAEFRLDDESGQPRA